MVLQLYYDWSNTDYIYLDCVLFLAVLFQMKKISWPWQFSRMAQRGGLFRTSLPLLEDFVELLHPQKLIAGTKKWLYWRWVSCHFGMIFQVPMWGFGRLYFKTTKRLLFSSFAKTGSIEIYHCKLQTSSILKNRQHPKTKKMHRTRLLHKNPTPRETFPFLIELTWWQDLQNSYGHTAASYAASNKYKAPWWCPCTPCKTNMEPKKLLVSPWNQGFSHCRLVPAVSCQGVAAIFGSGGCFGHVCKANSKNRTS